MTKPKAVLAYSGGLDTSVILRWMIEKGYEVTAFMADLGQEVDAQAVEQKARKIGAKDVRIVDARAEFVTDFIFPAIRANAMYEGRYLLGTSLARPLTALKQIQLAKSVGATILAHGATGKGNDQVRFELAARTLMPEATIYAPWKDPEFLAKFQGRSDLIDYANAHGIPISQTKKDPWSSDDNFMHISYEAGMLENPACIPFERMFKMTVSPRLAQDKEELVEIRFQNGNPVSVRGVRGLELDADTGLPQAINYEPEIHFDPVDMFTFLNQVAGRNGVGRIDMVESRFVGMKSRGVYETPAGTVLHFAHRDLEALTLDREIIKMNQHLSIDLATDIYNGFWFSPERIARQRAIDESQEPVSGFVLVGLYKGNVLARGRSSPNSLYNAGIASMDVAGGYDPTRARGFIDITAVRLQASSGRIKDEMDIK